MSTDTEREWIEMHAYHDILPGYHPDQVLHDGCEECEGRGADPSFALGKLDHINFVKAWQRAAEWNKRGLDNIAGAEVKLFRVLWAIQCQLENRGVPIGEVPGHEVKVEWG